MTTKPNNGAAHQEFTELFSEYYDDELDPKGRTLLEAHLAECEACQLAYDEFCAPLDALHGMDFTFAPDNFVREVTTSINRQTRGSFFADTWLFGFRVPFEAFAAVLLAVFGALYLFGSSTTPELIVTDAPDPQHAVPEEHDADLLDSALGASTATYTIEVPDHIDLGTLAAQLRANGFPLRADVSQGDDAIIIPLTPPEIPRFGTELRTLTGVDLVLTPLDEKASSTPITLRLVHESRPSDRDETKTTAPPKPAP